MRELIAGPNFSGRSAALRERLKNIAPTAFFIGPYAEAALSGLTSTVADEVAIYQSDAPNREAFTQLDFEAYATRKPPTLSGGEQMLLALHCFSTSRYRAIGIDTALEQLDPENRNKALSYLARNEIDTVLTDNRIDNLDGWTSTTLQATDAAFLCDLERVTSALAPRTAPTIQIDRLSFCYPGGRDIFRDMNLTLAPGTIYRLVGHNGAGKTTLFRLLAGVLAPTGGGMTLDGVPYAPWRAGNRTFALAAQNPDHQWCGATLAEDIARRRRALVRYSDIAIPDDAACATLAGHLGVPSLDQHLYELPLAARKRLSWLWAFAGAMPWVMLDEPTVGQDGATRDALSKAVARLASLGYGVLFITHDDAFANAIPHRALRLAGGTVA